MTPGQQDKDWLLERMPEATESQVEYFLERVGMTMQDDLQLDARTIVLEVIRK